MPTPPFSATRYAIVSVGEGDRRPDGPIYGIGATKDIAWTDAAEWTTHPEGCACYPITDALAAEVERQGGDVSYGFRIGTLCTEDEAETYDDALL